MRLIKSRQDMLILAFDEVGKGALKAVIRNCLWAVQEVRPHLAKPIYERIKGFGEGRMAWKAIWRAGWRIYDFFRASESLLARTHLMLVGPASARRYCLSPCNVEPT